MHAQLQVTYFDKPMPIEPKTIRDTMFARPDPAVFRGLAYILAAAVGLVDLALGGTWLGLLAGVGRVAVASLLLPTSIPKDDALGRLSIAIYNSLYWPVWARLGCVSLAVAGIATLDFSFDGLALGREFNLFLIPVFLSSLLFGMPLAIVTWLLSFITAYFCLIPPRYSFELGSPKDFTELVGYFYLGLITLAIPVLIRASSGAAQYKRPEDRHEA